MRCFWIFFMLSLLSGHLFAEINHQKIFDESSEWARALLKKPGEADLSIIKDIEPKFTASPQEASFNEKTIEQEKSKAMDHQSIKLTQESERRFGEVSTIMEEAWIKGVDNINEKIIEDPEKYISKQYKDCEQVPILSNPVLETRVVKCRESTDEVEFDCQQNLKIKVNTFKDYKAYDFLFHRDWEQVKTQFEALSKKLFDGSTFISTPMAFKEFFCEKAGLNPENVVNIIYKGSSGPWIRVSKNEKEKKKSYLFHIKKSQIVSENWVSNCSQLEQLDKEGYCFITNSECLDGPSEKDINGMSIKRDCWQRKITYRCGSPTKKTCANYRKIGCEQSDQKCIKKMGDHCLEYEKTYTCKKMISNPTGKYKLICADLPFCLNGDCVFDGYEANNDMLEAISKLKIFEELGKQLKKDGLHFFNGSVDKCRKNAFGFRSCCGTGSGWGKTLGAKCSSGEKTLSYKRNKGLCHFVGTYCSKKVLGQCVEKKQSHCCFTSKIQRILHEQIRPQLGLSWGSGKSPNCRGLTIEELARADWEKLDLSELFDEILSSLKVPDIGQLERSLKTSVQEKINIESIKKSTQSGLIMPKRSK